jgi:hypothetical protein
MFSGQYFFEGEAKIRCVKCGYSHLLSFSGMNPGSIEQSIDEALLSEGWGVASMTCPDCFDPQEERRLQDMQEEVEEYNNEVYDNPVYFGEKEDGESGDGEFDEDEFDDDAFCDE